MKAVHYFQRFSKKEDVVTNNTLLLLSRIQSFDPRALTQVLEEIVGEEDILKVGVRLTQQDIVGSRSSPNGKLGIPDGMLYQSSFRIVIETKLDDQFSIDQLQRHLAAFGDEKVKILLLLSPSEPRDFSQLKQSIHKTDSTVRVAYTTFSSLIQICRTILPEHDLAMQEVLLDFAGFCEEEELTAEANDDLMLVVGCSSSFDENRALRLYYASREKTPRPARYIGLYKDKSVRGIGKLERTTDAELVLEKLRLPSSEKPLSSEQESRVRQAMAGAVKYGWDVTSGHRFFLVHEFVLTDFAKKTKGSLRYRRYFNLRRELNLGAKDSLPDIKELGERLKTCSFS